MKPHFDPIWGGHPRNGGEDVLLADEGELKPIYEHLDVRLCNGEMFMLEFILPCLPQAFHQPYLLAGAEGTP